MASAFVKSENSAQKTSFTRKQKTLKKEIFLAGLALFTGAHIELSLIPAKPGRGVVFIRTDLPGNPEIPAHIEYVAKAERTTLLKKGDVIVQTVEHLLAALRALEIDNVEIALSGAELPIFDGSSRKFVEAIEKGGIQEQEAFYTPDVIQEPIYLCDDDVRIIALPSSSLRLTYVLHHPHSQLLSAQYADFSITPTIFKEAIAPARTFALYEEIAPLIEQGYFKGGDLSMGVVIKDEKVLNPEGTRFYNEMGRHKLLDLLGDLALIRPFIAHVIAIRSGHRSNAVFAKMVERTLEGKQ